MDILWHIGYSLGGARLQWGRQLRERHRLTDLLAGQEVRFDQFLIGSIALKKELFLRNCAIATCRNSPMLYLEFKRQKNTSEINLTNLKEIMKKTIFKLTTLAAAALLSACGGGSDTGLTPPPAQVAQSVPLVTSVAEPTYVRGSQEAAAFDHINAERTQCGFGKVAQNALLDKAALNHANYYVDNPGSDPHFEVPGGTGFTAVWPTDRAIAVGYGTNAREVLEVGSLSYRFTNLQFMPALDLNSLLLDASRGLMDVPYHAMAVFSPAIDVGIGWHKTDTVVNGIQSVNSAIYFEYGFGMIVNGQLPTSGTGIRTYPCNGTSGILPIFYDEWTGGAQVVSGRDLVGNPIGHPIMVFGEYGKTLELTSATITQVSTGTNIPIYALRIKANDPNPQLYRNDWTGYVLPDQGFIPGQSYRATISGKSGGVAFTTPAFTFTAGEPLAL